MLFILTGDIQIGKTRWLQRLIGALETRGVTPYGVVAPGVWTEHAREGSAPAYEKLGIDNELLPSHERIEFARRRDLAQGSVEAGACSQAEQAKLAWAIRDDAIERVNGHLRDVLDATQGIGAERTGAAAQVGAAEADGSAAPDDMPGMLIVDELGRLELLRGEGLTFAMDLLDRGSTPALPHALVVVRAQLLDAALERFGNAPWGGISPLSPDAEGERAVLGAYADEAVDR